MNKDDKAPDGPVGINMWTVPARRVGKTCKMDLIIAIAAVTHVKSLDISVLNISDLEKVLKAANDHKIISKNPVGRLKKPYIEALANILPDIKNLEKLSVASLQALTGAFKDGR